LAAIAAAALIYHPLAQLSCSLTGSGSGFEQSILQTTCVLLHIAMSLIRLHPKHCSYTFLHVSIAGERNRHIGESGSIA
jgi:p-aminobenzoyl-glutamate transporter AbgT